MRNKVRRLKILHIIPSVAACRGGPSKAVVEMVSSLIELGHDAEIATTDDNGPYELDVALNTLIDYNGAPTRFFKRFSPPLNAVREFAYSYRFASWLSKHITDYDVIHIHAIFSYCTSYAMYLARKQGIPYVVRPIGQLQQWSLQQSQSKKQIYLNIVERTNIESAHAVHFTANAEMREAKGQFALNGVVIPLGIQLPGKALLSKIDLLKRYDLTASEFTILYLSRLHKKKGLELLIQALTKFETVDFKLLIAGDGEQTYTEKLQTLAEDLNVGQKCHFLGHVEGDEKIALLRHSDLFALTSYSENFGISVLEAMSCELAPLISNEVALSEVVAENELGLVCTTEVDSIESQLRYAFTNQEKICSMGLEARRYAATHYSWTNIAKELNYLYDSLI